MRTDRHSIALRLGSVIDTIDAVSLSLSLSRYPATLAEGARKPNRAQLILLIQNNDNILMSYELNAAQRRQGTLAHSSA